jgi:hypothetical protein
MSSLGIYLRDVMAPNFVFIHQCPLSLGRLEMPKVMPVPALFLRVGDKTKLLVPADSMSQ